MVVLFPRPTDDNVGLTFSALLNANDAESKLREWSSLIGIVTAIVGNILISFALNIQRYAHIRLRREYDSGEKSWKASSKRKALTGESYGTQQGNVAEERAQINLAAPPENEDDPRHQSRYHPLEQEDDEVTPLKGFEQSRKSSNSTVKPATQGHQAMGSKTYLSSPYWWAGITLMILGEAGNFLAYGFAPASVVSPLGVVALVSNCIIAPCLLKERFRQRDLWGVLVAVGGAVCVVLSAKTSEVRMGPHALWAAITRWEFEAYIGITVALIIFLLWASEKYGEKTLLIDLGLVGLFGGYTALSTKGVASLLSDTLWRTLTFPITYLLVFVLVLTALLQIRYVNRALQRFDSTQVIPTQFVLFTISVIIGSAVLYRDFESATADRVGEFFGGCALTFLGVYLITSGRDRGRDIEDEVDGDEEGTIALIDEETQDTVLEEAQEIRQSIRRSFRKSSSQSQQPETPTRILSRNSSRPSVAIESDSAESPFLENPWQSAEDRLSPSTPRRPLHSTVSSPLPPTEGQNLDSPDPRSQTQQLLPTLKSTRPSTLTRASMSRMMPGPYISPLSSSLSAVVADSLRRGIDTPTKRRPRLTASHTQQSRTSAGAMSPGESAGGLPHFKGRAAADTGSNDEDDRIYGTSAKRRSQSLTTTLGDFFRLKRSREGGGDEARRGSDIHGSDADYMIPD